jgi:hypothetical protein
MTQVRLSFGLLSINKRKRPVKKLTNKNERENTLRKDWVLEPCGVFSVLRLQWTSFLIPSTPTLLTPCKSGQSKWYLLWFAFLNFMILLVEFRHFWILKELKLILKQFSGRIYTPSLICIFGLWREHSSEFSEYTFMHRAFNISDCLWNSQCTFLCKE